MATHSSILAWRIPWTEEPGYSPWLTNSQTQLSANIYTHIYVCVFVCIVHFFSGEKAYFITFSKFSKKNG